MLGVEKPVPAPAAGELLVQVLACAVCRTDLHVSEGDLPVHRDHVTPGHMVVGVAVALGEGVTSYAVGDRVGVAWLRHTDGTCAYCRRGNENLCPNSLYTGWDADGGYAEYTTVPAAFAYRLPAGVADTELAPLLCAGIIGYRALLRASLPDARQAWLVRIWGQRPPGRPGGAGTRRDRPRPDPRRGVPAARATSWAPRRPGAPTTPRRSPSTARSCSRPSGTSCQSRCGHLTVAESSPLPGST